MSSPTTSWRAGDHEAAAPVIILGLGQMGLVCAGMLTAEAPASPGGSDVLMWGHNPEEVRALAHTRHSPRLPEFKLPAGVGVTADDAAVASARIVVVAVPVQFMREAIGRLAHRFHPEALFVSVSKGIENGTLLRPTQIIADALTKAGRSPDLPAPGLAVLSGPTIAAELARCLPAAMIAASEEAELARRVQSRFRNAYVRVYTHADVTGVELAGAVKNVIAIAAGVCDGLKAGHNAKSALLARGLAEIVRLGEAMGASRETFFGVAGVGDLATSCFSPEGRNRSCGEALGRGAKLADYLARTPSVVEGVATTKSVVELSRRHGVDMPIVQAVHGVLFEGIDPVRAIGRLMARDVGGERVG
jgi:glycerol-3-phosphate dehydrogenase (NAD(P)+)